MPRCPPSALRKPTGKPFHGRWPTRESARTRNSARTGGLNSWTHHLSPDAADHPWTPQDNAALLALHSLHHSRWKLIASQLSRRTGAQTKNQFFNLVRTLLRKAFKRVFQRTETFLVAQIKPRVLSAIANQPLSVLFSSPDRLNQVTVKDFLVGFVDNKWAGDSFFAHAKEVLCVLKSKLLSIKFPNQPQLPSQQTEPLAPVNRLTPASRC